MDRKRFPADTKLDTLTFLNDKKINGELYAYLQGISKYDGNKDKGFITYVLKSDMPKQAEMCKMLGISSPKTYRTHLKYLIDSDYLKELEDRYILPEVEDIYFLIPLDTLRYLNDNCKEHVIKLYIYLGQKYKTALFYQEECIFTLEDLGNHIGKSVKNNSRAYEALNNALTFLYNSGLIDYCSFYDGSMQKKKLLSFSFEHNRNEK